MRPLRYSINVTLDVCCDHREGIADEELHRHAIENIAEADALLVGRVTYEMMEAGWRRPAAAPVARPEWMEDWMERPERGRENDPTLARPADEDVPSVTRRNYTPSGADGLLRPIAEHVHCGVGSR
jgi:hypothetical protein